MVKPRNSTSSGNRIGYIESANLNNTYNILWGYTGGFLRYEQENTITKNVHIKHNVPFKYGYDIYLQSKTNDENNSGISNEFQSDVA